MRICLRPVCGTGWHGGVQYVRNAIEALSHTDAEIWLHLLPNDATLLHQYSDLLNLCQGILWLGTGEVTLRGQHHLSLIHCNSWQAVADQFDLYFPVVLNTVRECPVALSWVPDFQHRYLPDFFAADEVAARDHQLRLISQDAAGVVFSSQAALSDWKRFFPDSGVSTHVLRFASCVRFNEDPKLADLARNRFCLPHDFFVCINQFWMHKDHATLFHALAKASEGESSMHVVLTGGTEDYRNKTYFDSLMRLIDSLGIRSCVTIMGFIPRDDQLQILRSAKGVIQPSLFEGWSTAIEDARGVGLPVLASDLAVHLEQAPPGLLTFTAGDSDALADKLKTAWDLWPSGPILQREEVAAADVALRQKAYGNAMLALGRAYSQRQGSK